MTADAQIVNFARGMRRRRRELKMSRAHLARLAPVSLRTLDELERGEHGPTLHTALRIAAALGTTLDALTRDN